MMEQQPQQLPLQQQQQATFTNQPPTQYQQQPPPPLQEFYQPAATTSQPSSNPNGQQQPQPVYAVAPDLQNHTSAMQPAFANSPRQRTPAPLSQQGEYFVTPSGDDRQGNVMLTWRQDSQRHQALERSGK
jgi:hypothetical protein